ncbi:hypothetical protein, partial [Plasmodium yoelii yoelii]
RTTKNKWDKYINIGGKKKKKKKKPKKYEQQ